MPHNQVSQLDLRSGAVICAKRYASTNNHASTAAVAARRYAKETGKMMKILVTILTVCTLVSTSQAGVYTATIDRIQAEGIGDNFNVIYPNVNITDSPCTRTNNENRLTIKNEAQMSVALAALISDKKVTIQGSGNCNEAGIETANYIMIYRNQ
ncbi:hypothetical protein P886_4768 [Alteromonadaceae bacterium 2753L.S.0a.02]|nr:hypothetical protein P886_4768 [Alteromonadaceae bacterium 2753L.S.0a.02]